MIKNVTVMGGGVLGTQIALQAAYSGFNVTIKSFSLFLIDLITLGNTFILSL